MKWKIIQPTGDDCTEKEKETVMSFEGPDDSCDICIYCHIDGHKYIIGWFHNDGCFRMMIHSEAAQQRLESVGFKFKDKEVRII